MYPCRRHAYAIMLASMHRRRFRRRRQHHPTTSPRGSGSLILSLIWSYYPRPACNLTPRNPLPFHRLFSLSALRGEGKDRQCSGALRRALSPVHLAAGARAPAIFHVIPTAITLEPDCCFFSFSSYLYYNAVIRNKEQMLVCVRHDSCAEVCYRGNCAPVWPGHGAEGCQVIRCRHRGLRQLAEPAGEVCWLSG
jgi:hypothetical protein